MFFKKRREAAKQKAQQATLDGFQSMIDSARDIPDVADRLTKMSEIHQAMSAAEGGELMAIKKKGFGRYILPAAAVGIGAISIGGAVVSAFAFPPSAMILAMVPGAVGAIATGVKVASSLESRDMVKIAPYLDALNEKKAALADSIEALVKENMQVLAATRAFTSLQEKPGLREIFLSALQQKVAAPAPEPEPQPPAAPKKPGNGFNL